MSTCNTNTSCAAATYDHKDTVCLHSTVELSGSAIDRGKRNSVVSSKKLPPLFVKLEYEGNWESEYNEITGWVRRGKGGRFDESIKMSKELSDLNNQLGVHDQLSTVSLGPLTGVQIWEHEGYTGKWIKLMNTSRTQNAWFSMHDFDSPKKSVSIRMEKDQGLGNSMYDSESSLKIFRVPLE
jgi:hypothetical protein